MTGGKFTGWRKSTYSDANGNCVEAAANGSAVAVRDTRQHGNGPVIEFPAAAWTRFITDAKERLPEPGL